MSQSRMRHVTHLHGLACHTAPPRGRCSAGLVVPGDLTKVGAAVKLEQSSSPTQEALPLRRRCTEEWMHMR